MARQANSNASSSLPASNPNRKAAGAVPAHIMGPRILLLLSTLALLLIGLVMVFSTSSIVAISNDMSASGDLVKQLGFAAVGIAGCVALWKFVPYSAWAGRLVWVVWGLAIASLIATWLFGTEILGAKRWLYIGPVGLQPSEFVKIAFLLMAARILLNYREGSLDFRSMVVQAALLILVPLLFLYRTQSDLGTTLICFVGILTVMWLGEVPWRIIVGILVAGLVLVVLATLFVGYRADRLIFLNPWNDGMNGLDDGYQLIHSFYAFSEGGLFGVGLGNSREKFLYLPYADTDFIFAIVGEEMGLLGALFVIALFLAILYAGMHIARSAPDSLGMMIAGGCTTMLVFQAFLNIGCTIGVLPTTGKPLPFISSGGSSLIASLWMVGLILSVSNASSQPSVYEQRRADLRVVRAEAPAPTRGRAKAGAPPRKAAPPSRAASSGAGGRGGGGGGSRTRPRGTRSSPRR